MLVVNVSRFDWRAAVDLLEADVPLQFYLGDVDGGDAVSALHGGAGAVAGENL